MKTQSPMTTDERIASWEEQLNLCIQDLRDGESLLVDDAVLAVACELRALRLMLRDEIREAAWPLKQWAEEMSRPVAAITFPEGLTAEQRGEFVRRWNAASPFEQPPAPAGIPYGKDSEEAQAIERVIAEADAERKASDE